MSPIFASSTLQILLNIDSVTSWPHCSFVIVFSAISAIFFKSALSISCQLVIFKDDYMKFSECSSLRRKRSIYVTLNHPKVLQSFCDCSFLLRWALELFGILRLRFIIIFTFNNTAFLLYLCDIKTADLQAGMLKNI